MMETEQPVCVLCGNWQELVLRSCPCKNAVNFICRGCIKLAACSLTATMHANRFRVPITRAAHSIVGMYVDVAVSWSRVGAQGHNIEQGVVAKCCMSPLSLFRVICSCSSTVLLAYFN